ncbi:MAG TPA: response regulator transcription factor [Roseiflexaceae bacterium]|nr:response regulator transcription factor [Roseiflexaceae bacterium]HMP42759.1 response regulator transcription factor [Roseiflexaceae bacterium]
MSTTGRLLVVDDEANIRATLRALLERAGHEVTIAAGGREAIDTLNTQSFDLMLVDLKMPGIDGMQVVSHARDTQPDMMVIVLTGHGSLDTAIEGLRHGIFDYLLKTSEPAHVIERVRAGLMTRAQEVRRRSLLDTVGAALQELRGVDMSAEAGAASTERVIVVGGLQLDTWRQGAMLDGRALSLTPTEFRVLLCLAEHVGTMMSYAQLVKCAQGYEASDMEAGELIKPHIHHLRQKLEPDPSAPRYILNVRGKGYLLSMSAE